MRLAYLRRQGSLVQANSGPLLLGLTVTLLALCFAIKSAKFDLDLNNWLQKSSLVEAELNYITQANGENAGSNSELIIQTPISENNTNNNGVLNVDAMMIHLEAMAMASHISVDLFGVTWTLKDICFRPTLPNIEGFEVTNLLDRMMPCAIKTPLDCFWEGSRLHGPHDMRDESPQAFGFKKWPELDPIAVIEKIQESRPHASIDYQSLLEWMRRVGIKHGYQRKPCLDPTDPNCPQSAPNKQSRAKPNIGHYLTGGCFGIAENQMHWREEEIVGGSVKNKSGFIVRASAIQSSIPLMCEQDLYEYWSKTRETIDINNWSIEKAKMILDAWEQRFREVLEVFTRSTLPSESSQKIHSISSKSMLEPIDTNILLDYTNFLLAFSLMTLITCLSFPRFKFNSKSADQLAQDEKMKLRKIIEDPEDPNEKSEDNIIQIDAFNSIQLALAASILVGLTFVGSLGFCSFMNLQFNLATTQILPPLALYYGFNQLNSIVNIYSQKFGKVPMNELTTSCLIESFPIIITESKVYLIALTVSTLIPIPATRSLALQAITHILIATLVALVLLPAIITNFLLKEYQKHLSIEDSDSSEQSDYNSEEEGDTDCSDYYDDYKKSQEICDRSKDDVSKRRSTSFARNLTRSPLGCKSNKSAKQRSKCEHDNDDSDDIFSRIQDDLRNIQVDSRNNTPTNLQHNNTSYLPPALETSFNNGHNNNRSTITLNRSCNLYHPFINTNQLPDSLASTIRQPQRQNFIDDFLRLNDCASSTVSECSTIDIKDLEQQLEDKDSYNKEFKAKVDCDSKNEDAIEVKEEDYRSRSIYLDFFIKNFISNRYAKVFVFLIKLALLIQLLPYAQQVKFGIQLTDIISQGTEQYDSFSAQEKYFSIYNIFAVTKGNFDYPAKQKLLHDYYKTISNVDGIVKDKNVKRFWLIAFKDWLIDLQQKFDIDWNKAYISNEGWTDMASEASKLAYKLLAQTGRSDYPIDRSSITTNRLVDSNGIINPRAFYYYLTAWVSSDSFVYATTEANFKPEPKIMKDDPKDLRIEKARPLTYAQIPFLMKLNHGDDNVKLISKIRNISKTYEQMSLPNFPTGIPFIFWDQFLNIDYLTLMAIIIVIISMFLVFLDMSSKFNNAAIVVIPIVLTLVELYCFMGLLKIQFNNIVAVLVIGSIGIMLGQSLHYVAYFANVDGDSNTIRVDKTIRNRLTIVITSLALLFSCLFVFLISRVDFMTNYSYLLLGLFQSNLYNSLLIIPMLLCKFGSSYKPNSYYSDEEVEDATRRRKRRRDNRERGRRGKRGKSSSSLSSTSKMRKQRQRNLVGQDKSDLAGGSYFACSNNKDRNRTRNVNNSNNDKTCKNIGKRSRRSSSLNKQQILDYQRKVQSEQSLSTISEEP